MRILALCVLLGLCLAAPALAVEQIIDVADDTGLRAALAQARPGTRIRIAPGNYRPAIYLSGLRGTEQAPIVIEGARPDSAPLFEGGNEAWHLSDCAYVTLRHIAVRGQKRNGVNVDDAGSFDTPAHHIRLEYLRVSDIGPQGNYDPIKLSGVDDFAVVGCRIEGWGGQAVDMVGCHRGLIEHCSFRGKQGFSQSAGPQTKGGSSQILIRNCRFEGPVARAVNLGGSTGMAYFRPRGAPYEARDITVEGCTFIGGQAPVAFVGVDGAQVRYNTIYRPAKWVLRILQETTAPGFVSCRRGRFEHNLVVFRRAEVSVFVNIGPHTQPGTFVFADNWWYCQDRPEASRPQLPTPEVGGIYGINPRLTKTAAGLRPLHPRATGHGAHAKPGNRTHAKPDDGTHAKPGNRTHAKPDDGTHAKPGNRTRAKPDDGTR